MNTRIVNFPRRRKPVTQAPFDMRAGTQSIVSEDRQRAFAAEKFRDAIRIYRTINGSAALINALKLCMDLEGKILALDRRAREKGQI